MIRRLFMLSVGLLVLLAAAACSSGADKVGTSGSAAAQRLTVTVGNSLSFEPLNLAAQAGKPVLLTVRSTGGVDHDFVITGMPATGIENEIKGGRDHGSQVGAIVGHPAMHGEVTIRFTPTVPGTYEFYCSVFGHREAGMVGTITVM